jgi:hypothetical protein
MRRLYAGFTGLGVLALILSLGAPWWVLSLEGGAQVPVSGLTASPLASSLLAAAAAAFGLGLLLRGVRRRIVSLVQVLAAGAAASTIASLATRPEVGVLSEIASLTGVAGSGALDVVATTEAKNGVKRANRVVCVKANTAVRGTVSAVLDEGRCA